MDDNKELDSLLKELKNNRENLHEMLDDISKFRKSLEILLPEKMDFRNRHLMRERMNSVTEILRGELAIRGQIDSSIKLEIDIRRKNTEEEVDDLPTQIRMYAKAMELLEEKKEKTINKLPEKLKIIKNDEGNDAKEN